MMGTSVAAVFSEVGQPLKVRDFPQPVPVAGEALVEIECCTICGSDLHTIHGRRPISGPAILGHEAIGKMLHISSSQKEQGLELGQRVSWSIVASCQSCARCRQGLPQKCLQLKKFGHETIGQQGPLSGGLASHAILPAGTTIVPVPSDLPAAVVAPANCATATVVAAFRKAGACQGKNVLVVGAGILGLTAVALAKSRGADTVDVADPKSSRLQLAARFGASRCEESVQELPNDHYDFVFDMSGMPAAIEAGLVRLRVGGALMLVGSVFPSRPMSISAERLVRSLIRIEGIHNYRPDDLVAAIDFLTNAARDFPFAELVNQTFALSDVNEAIRAAEDSVRVAVRP